MQPGSADSNESPPQDDTGTKTQIRTLEVHPSIVFELGRDLISDPIQALVELVKNCYDADSKTAIVTINTLAEDGGFISITDQGMGMTAARLARGWLTVSNSLKRQSKQAGFKTPSGRTPLGDKGVGRLATQRLAAEVTIVTRPDPSGYPPPPKQETEDGDLDPGLLAAIEQARRDHRDALLEQDLEHEITVRWTDYTGKASLSDVPLSLKTRPATRTHGTTLMLKGLHEPELWRTATNELQTGLSALLSPYDKQRFLDLVLIVDTQTINLYEATDKVRAAAEITYDFQYGQRRLAVTGSVALDYFRPPNKADQPDYNRMVLDDRGAAFWKYLTETPRHARALSEMNMRRVQNGRHWVTYQQTFDLQDIKGVVLDDKRSPVDPGPFHGEIDSVDLGDDRNATFSSRADFRQLVHALNGVRIYRDGFGIRVDKDWLGLGARWSTGSSYYNLKPDNVLGYVAISAANNGGLIEKTDREGFTVTPQYRNFMLLMQQVRGFSEKAQAFLRRAYVAYRKQVLESEAGLPDIETTPEALVARLGERVREAEKAAGELVDARRALEAEVSSFRTYRGDQQNPSLDLDPDGQGRLADRASTLAEAAKGTQDLLDELGAEGPGVELLAYQVEQMREQVALAHEAIALGLAAEAVSHEVAQIAEGLSRRSTDLRTRLRGQHDPDRDTLRFVEHVRAAVTALRRQLAHLNPALRYVRERREEIDVEVFLDDLAAYHKTRLERGPIRVERQHKVGPPFKVLMNPGRLTQVLDNLINNAEYWLLEDHRLGRVQSPTITLVDDRPHVRVSDNGRGVARNVIGTLFEPFVTTKASGRGRGLGLYVVEQLLNAEGMTIRLLPANDQDGRRSTFEVDLSAGLKSSAMDGVR